MNIQGTVTSLLVYVDNLCIKVLYQGLIALCIVKHFKASVFTHFTTIVVKFYAHFLF